MPSGIYKRTDYHRRKIREADNSGRFKTGHKLNIGNQYSKGLHPSTEFKKGQNEGAKHPNWKGGKTIDKSGYVLVKNRNHPFCSPTGYIREHRLVVEKQIGRYLLLTERVHHLGAKDDNQPHMLMLFINSSAHRRFEKGGQYSQMEIIFDGRKLCKN